MTSLARGLLRHACAPTAALMSAQVRSQASAILPRSRHSQYHQVHRMSSEALPPQPLVRRTTLPNGVKVVTQKEGPGWSSITTLLRVAPRHEQGQYTGSSLMAEMQSFKGNEEQSSEEVAALIDAIGGDLLTQRTKEGLLHSVNCLQDDVPDVISTLSKSISKPLFTQHDLEANLQHLNYIRMDQHANSKQLVNELLHKASYSPGPLSQQQLPAEEDVRHLTASSVKEFYQACLQPEWITIGAVGVDHDAFCACVQEGLGHLVPSDTSILNLEEPVFKGGEEHIVVDQSPVHPAIGMQLAHIGLAFESVPTGPQQYVYYVLQALLGGGSSFSAGGPGKGIHSRLYQNCLNRLIWVESAQAMNNSMGDTGMFLLEASVTPEQASNGYLMLVRQLLMCLGPLDDSEVLRARNQLKNLYLTTLESAAVCADAYARQYDRDFCPSPLEECAAIDAITGRDLNDAAYHLLTGPLAAASYSAVNDLPTAEAIKESIATALLQMGVAP